MKVLILGASQKPERYSHQAMNLLLEKGHEVVLVHPKLQEIDGRKVYNAVEEVKFAVDTVTMYINPRFLDKMKEAIVKLAPRRIIFNPGSEDEDLICFFKDKGIIVVEACTLVMLKTNIF